MSKIAINQPDGKGNDSFTLVSWCTLKLNGTYEKASKCKHNKGRWLIEDDEGQLHLFDPPTQLQKDLWLSACENEHPYFDGKPYLRWHCWYCDTVQMP